MLARLTTRWGWTGDQPPGRHEAIGKLISVDKPVLVHLSARMICTG
jgi:hypothetical protein